tara:strand:+ start:3413 stop:4039 length:627 start_codon:yes stop_codon:yes gene_type:complete
VKDYQEKFLSLAIESGAFKLGDFTLKSGRQSPYFFNAASFLEYGHLNQLAEVMAEKIAVSEISFDIIFGPAYKGIFLASVLATKLNKPLCFNRKEEKDHGEGGSLIGAKPAGKVLIVDDVISSGLAIREALNMLKPYDVEIVGAFVTLDRQEKSQKSDLMASAELKAEGIDVFTIISLDNLLDAEDIINEDDLHKIKDYRKRFRGKDV